MNRRRFFTKLGASIATAAIAPAVVPKLLAAPVDPFAGKYVLICNKEFYNWATGVPLTIVKHQVRRLPRLKVWDDLFGKITWAPELGATHNQITPSLSIKTMRQALTK